MLFPGRGLADLVLEQRLTFSFILPVVLKLADKTLRTISLVFLITESKPILNNCIFKNIN